MASNDDHTMQQLQSVHGLKLLKNGSSQGQYQSSKKKTINV
jgi:hypothetical protein